MQIIERLAPLGTACRSGRARTGFLGITIHNTSNWSNGATAMNHANYLRNGGRNKYVSWHYVVDKDYAIRCVPENEIAWCQGDGANGNGNCKTISIEICDNADGNITQATNNAVELAASILKRYGVKDASKYLFQHNHWTGKDCPYDIRRGKPYNWSTFVSKVQEKMGGNVKPTPAPSSPDQVLYKGSKVKFNGKFRVDYIAKGNLFSSTALIGGKPSQPYHWLPANDFTEVGGTNKIDQVLYPGSVVSNNHIYTVQGIDARTDAAKLFLNGRTVWVKAKYLYETSNR